jgi:hypothetical protein
VQKNDTGAINGLCNESRNVKVRKLNLDCPNCSEQLDVELDRKLHFCPACGEPCIFAMDAATPLLRKIPYQIDDAALRAQTQREKELTEQLRTLRGREGELRKQMKSGEKYSLRTRLILVATMLMICISALILLRNYETASRYMVAVAFALILALLTVIIRILQKASYGATAYKLELARRDTKTVMQTLAGVRREIRQTLKRPADDVPPERDPESPGGGARGWEEEEQ